MTISCATCSSALDEGIQICPNCGSAVAAHPGVVETGATETPAYKPANDLKAIGGWLVLPAVGLAISPIERLFRITFNIQALIARERLASSRITHRLTISSSTKSSSMQHLLPLRFSSTSSSTKKRGSFRIA